MLRMKLGRSREDRIINVVTAVLCIFVLIVTVYPVYYCLIYSFNDGRDAARQALYFWPRKFSLEKEWDLVTTSLRNSLTSPR